MGLHWQTDPDVPVPAEHPNEQHSSWFWQEVPTCWHSARGLWQEQELNSRPIAASAIQRCNMNASGEDG
jgi:hypothetical protein